MLFNVASDFAGTLQALSTAYKSQMAGYAQTASLRRGALREITVGPVSNPATQDCNIIYTVQRITADGGTSTGTPVPIYVPAIEAGTPPAAGSLWKSNYSSESTYANRLWSKFLNQHSGFIWYAPDDVGLPWPAVNANGVVCMAKGATSDYTGTVAWEVKFEE